MRSYQIGKGKHFEFWSLISSTALQWLVTKHHSFLELSFLTLERCRLLFFKSSALHSVIDIFPVVLFTMNLLSLLTMSSATRHNNVNTEKKIQSEFNSENVSVLKCHNFSLIDWLETFGQSTTFSLYRSAKKILYFHLLLYL